MLKTCHVTSGHQVTDTRILKRECVLLRENGFDITLVAQHAGGAVVEGVPISSLPLLGPRWYQRFILLVPILLKILTQDYKLVHFHDPDLLPVMLAYSWLKSRPVVWDAHENYESVIAQSNRLKISTLSRLVAKIYNSIELRACRLAKAKVVTVSEAMADRYRAAGLEAIACANYVDHKRIPFPAKTDRATPPLIIMTGTIQGGAFEAELLEAFSILRTRINSKLAFWGNLWPPFRNVLEKRAKELGVSHAVECAGPFHWEQLVTQLVPQSSVAVYVADPSVAQFRHEIPNRLFEYWANGVPVIVAKGTLCAELVDGVKGGRSVKYGSIPELLAALEELLIDPDLTRVLGENGRNAVLDSYNWSKEGSKLIDLYNKILSN